MPAKNIQVPDPFPIPTFKEEVEISLGKKKVCTDDRKYIVRVLATVLLTHVQKPSMRQCEIVAKALVRKFPFLKEHVSVLQFYMSAFLWKLGLWVFVLKCTSTRCRYGDWLNSFLQHSWTDFIYTRCQNVNRKTKQFVADHKNDMPKPSKKQKFDPEKHGYPPLCQDVEDETSLKRNISLLQQELAKAKPNFDSVASLMSRTFQNRRQWILDNTENVVEIVKIYPFLSKSAYVSYPRLEMYCNMRLFSLCSGVL